MIPHTLSYRKIGTQFSVKEKRVAVRMKLLSFIHYQRYMGLTDIEYSSFRECYVLNGNWVSYLSQVLIQIMFFADLIEALNRKSIIYIDMESRSGNIYEHLVVLSIPTTQIFVSVWLRFQQNTQQILLEKLNQLASRLHVDTESLPRPRWLFRFWLNSLAYYTCIVLVFTLFVWNPLRYWSYYLAFASFFVLLVRSTYLIIYYTSLVHEVLVMLQTQSDQLQGIVDSNEMSLSELSCNLCLYDELLLVCQQEIVEIFSGTFIMIFSFFLLDAISILYIAALKEKFSLLEILRQLIWFVPWMIYQSMPMTVNELRGQVSKRKKNKYRYHCIYMYMELRFVVYFSLSIMLLLIHSSNFNETFSYDIFSLSSL